MKPKKKKFYVVWSGKQTGIFTTWNECEKAVKGVEGAQYKSYDTIEKAKAAFKMNYYDCIEKGKITPKNKIAYSEGLHSQVIIPSFAVDGAWNTKTGDCEYRGVDVETGAEIFRQGPYTSGTNNIVEFLGIVHALAFCKQRNITWPIYSDSVTAMSWVKHKQASTTHERNEKNKVLFDLIERAENWLINNQYPNKILKWDSENWGENPADFGRK
jgi:ribonuclease HI